MLSKATVWWKLLLATLLMAPCQVQIASAQTPWRIVPLGSAIGQNVCTAKLSGPGAHETCNYSALIFNSQTGDIYMCNSTYNKINIPPTAPTLAAACDKAPSPVTGSIDASGLKPDGFYPAQQVHPPGSTEVLISASSLPSYWIIGTDISTVHFCVPSMPKPASPCVSATIH
jgi:hypothetical protein